MRPDLIALSIRASGAMIVAGPVASSATLPQRKVGQASAAGSPIRGQTNNEGE